jgi:hypothetical protein
VQAAPSRLLQRLLGVLGGLSAAGVAGAVDLPENRAEAIYHVYDGGGTRASGPALLVRKSIADKFALSGSYYVDAVSNASIDVVTSASPYKETRREYGVGFDYVVRDATITLSTSESKEPDYIAKATSIDLSQETFGGMTTVSLGFTRARDQVGEKGVGFFDAATHWRYRFGVTQILTPRWVASFNTEVVSDDGFLGSPYRVAREFGAFVDERLPRTRTSRALMFRVIGDLGSRNAVYGSYRYLWDTWDIKAHTAELGYRRYLGDRWFGDASLRYHTQTKALFYSDNAPAQNLYVTRHKQLSTFDDIALGAKVAYTWRRVPGQYDIKLNGVFERMRFNFSDFTDIRNGSSYSYDANVIQVFVSATF